MDLLFKKYASPFVLLDEYISWGRFCEFIDEFIKEENETRKYDYWLHKVWDKSYDEFSRSLEPKPEVKKEDLETTISNSRNMMMNFKPTK